MKTILPSQRTDIERFEKLCRERDEGYRLHADSGLTTAQEAHLESVEKEIDALFRVLPQTYIDHLNR